MNLINFIYKSSSSRFAPMKFSLIVLLVLTIASCNKPTNVALDVQAFNERVQSVDYQVLDIRTTEVFKKGHIERAVNLPYNSSDFKTPDKALYLDMPICIYGNDESEQVAAAQELSKKGYKDIYVLKGAFASWKSSNLPIIEEKEKKIYESDTISFEEARKGNKLVMVDFNATWCGPCKKIEPFVHRLHDNRDTDVIVYSIDTDQRPELASEYTATYIPLLVFIKNNKELYRSTGEITEQELNALVDKYK